MLNELGAAFGVTPVRASLTVGATAFAVALAAPFVGLAADRRGRKGFIVASLFVLIIPTLLAGTADSLAALTAWRFAQGLAIPGVIAVMMAYLGEEFGLGNLGAVMSANVTGNVVGGFSGRFIGGWMSDNFGWKWAFAVLGGLTFIGALLVWKWLPPSRHARPIERSASLGAFFSVLRRHLANRSLLAVFAVAFNVLFCLTGAFTYVIIHLGAPPFSLSAGALGSIFVVYLAGAVTTPIFGQYLDRMGYRLALALSASAVVAGLGLTLVPSLVAIGLGLGIISSATFVSQSAATSALNRTVTHQRSAAAGLYLFFYYGGGGAGALLPGLAWQAGGWSACVGLLVLVQIVTVTVALVTWPRGRAGGKVAAASEVLP